ncbi:MAG: hypothetical protein AAGJ82_13055, partial [Bacteroidota bacterium]
MKIQRIAREDIDKTKWNSCVHYATNGNIFGYLWYLDAMSRDWEALVEGDYESVLPLPRKDLSWGEEGLQQPPLVRELAIYSIHPPANKRTAAFWEAVPAKYRYVALEMDAFSLPKASNWQVAERKNYFLPLSETYELLRERYSQSLIDQLRATPQDDLFPASNLKPERLAQLYRSANRHLSEPEFHGLQRIMYNALHRGWGFASGIMNREQEVLAADFFLFSHGRVMSLCPFETKAGNDLNAQAYLYDLMIRQQAAKPQALDFNCVNDQRNELAKQFGPTLTAKRLSTHKYRARPFS